jgi:hypothetical protein
LLVAALPLHNVVREVHIDGSGVGAAHCRKAASPAQSQAALLTWQQNVTVELPPYTPASALLPAAAVLAVAAALGVALLASRFALVPLSPVAVPVGVAPLLSLVAAPAASTPVAGSPATPPTPEVPPMPLLLTPLHAAASTRATRTTRFSVARRMRSALCTGRAGAVHPAAANG